MPIGSVTVHTGVPIIPATTGEWIEGEEDVEDVDGTPFDCLLQLPTGGREDGAPRGRRTITQPQILYESFDVNGSEFSLSAEDMVNVTAPELTGPDPVQWQVDGDPTPLAKPGFLIGYLARLKRVDD